MRDWQIWVMFGLVMIGLLSCSSAPSKGGDLAQDAMASGGDDVVDAVNADDTEVAPDPVRVRFASFNVAMSDFSASGDLAAALVSGLDKASQVAEIIQRVKPDVILLNEFDQDDSGEALQVFQDNYLGQGQGDQSPLTYPHTYAPACNTGVLSEVDLDGDSQVKLPADAYGYGKYPGQYCMVVLSMFPLELESVRTFQKLKWSDMPESLLPDDYYSQAASEVFRISSKTHADLPLEISGRTVHFLISHPTPPVFDGPEDRNGRRNFDEIRIWADYIEAGRSDYLVDDSGIAGGLSPGAHFVIAGDLNADPDKGDSVTGAIGQLLESPLIDSSQIPSGAGGVTETSTFDLRVDYVLPSKTLAAKDVGMFLPEADDAAFELTRASDHRLVWIDVEVP